MYQRFLAAILLLLCCGAVAASDDKEAVLKQVESSMVVTGTIDIDAEGRVTGYVLDQEEAYDPGVLPVVGSVLEWRFEPPKVDGQPRPVRVPMRLRLIAKKVDGAENVYNLSIRSAWFGSDEDADPRSQVTARRLTPPKYPESARSFGVTGTVYVVLRVGRNGRPEEVFAEQTNLTVLGTEVQMAQWRRDLEKSAIRAAHNWTFHPPTDPEPAALADWDVRVPVSYVLRGFESEIARRPGKRKRTAAKPGQPGQWQSYIPGPHHQVPWLQMTVDSSGVDAAPPGSVQQLGTGVKLLTKLNAS